MSLTMLPGEREGKQLVFLGILLGTNRGEIAMITLAAAALLFLGIHLVVSGTRLRDGITSVLGEKLYTALFALASLGAIVWLCTAFGSADRSAANTVLFDAGQGFRNLGTPVMLLAFALIVPGVTRGNPTSAGQDKAPLNGVLRITRHPFLWGVMLWSGFHLIGAGTLAATLFFGTFFLVASLGTRAIDGKVRRKRPETWAALATSTSNIPFAAILAGKNRFVVGEYFDWRFGLALVLFTVFLWFHSAIFGVPAVPPSALTLL
jgi:uncharacterized membrane protein